MIKKIIERMKNEFEFKEEVVAGDLVIWINEGTMNPEIRFAKIMDIQPDEKEGWWKFTFLFLLVPPQKGTIVVPYENIIGESIFQLKGRLTWIKPIKDKKLEPQKNSKFQLIKGGKNARKTSL